MRLAASNLAWPAGCDREAMVLLRDAGFTGIEVAPTRVWPGWEGAVPAAAARLRTMFSGEGFTVPAIQAILFGAGDVALFGDHGQRARLRDHLLRAADLAAALGAGVMVFGAPSARRRGSLPPAEAMAAAADFLAAAGRDISSRGTVLCIEPNPAAYGCDFVTTSADGASLVEASASPGIGLHLDAAGMALAGEDAAAAVRTLAGRFAHFHASEPDLGPWQSPSADHAGIGAALAGSGYPGWVSLEMREQPEPWLALWNALSAVRRAYGA